MLQKLFADEKKYNVLFIISDDLRTELGCYGSKLAKTPNIDALAKKSVQFNHAYCQFPLCNPSRTSLLTGLQPKNSGGIGNRDDFRVQHPDLITLPQHFKNQGYTSIRIGKIFHGGIDDVASWTIGGDPDRTLLTPKGKAKNNPESGKRKNESDRIIILDGDGEKHGDYKSANRTIELLKKYKDQPFFLACGFVKPHSPPTAPRKYFDLWKVEDIPLPVDFATKPTVPEGFPKAAIRPKNADLFIGRDASEIEAKEMIRAYLASSAWMDWNVGRVLKSLDELGLRKNTIIVFWGDHGYQLGEKGKWSKAGSLFEQGCRTPLLISVPDGEQNGKSCERIVQMVDLYPTLCELCGIAPKQKLDGLSLSPLLKNVETPWDHPAYTIWQEGSTFPHGISVRIEGWRYTEFGKNAENGSTLFDLNADPNELKNLSSDDTKKDIIEKCSKLVRDFYEH